MASCPITGEARAKKKGTHLRTSLATDDPAAFGRDCLKVNAFVSVSYKFEIVYRRPAIRRAACGEYPNACIARTQPRTLMFPVFFCRSTLLNSHP